MTVFADFNGYSGRVGNLLEAEFIELRIVPNVSSY